MTKNGIKKLFDREIASYKKESKDAAQGWGLDALCFALKLEEIRDKILGEIPQMD